MPQALQKTMAIGLRISEANMFWKRFSPMQVAWCQIELSDWALAHAISELGETVAKLLWVLKNRVGCQTADVDRPP